MPRTTRRYQGRAASELRHPESHACHKSFLWTNFGISQPADDELFGEGVAAVAEGEQGTMRIPASRAGRLRFVADPSSAVDVVTIELRCEPQDGTINWPIYGTRLRGATDLARVPASPGRYHWRLL